MDEDYAIAESLVKYSATLSDQKAADKDDRYNVVYTARCGMKGMSPTNSYQPEPLADKKVVHAVFHDQIRADLIAIAKKKGEYCMSHLLGLIYTC